MNRGAGGGGGGGAGGGGGVVNAIWERSVVSTIVLSKSALGN